MMDYEAVNRTRREGMGGTLWLSVLIREIRAIRGSIPDVTTDFRDFTDFQSKLLAQSNPVKPLPYPPPLALNPQNLEL